MPALDAILYARSLPDNCPVTTTFPVSRLRAPGTVYFYSFSSSVSGFVNSPSGRNRLRLRVGSQLLRPVGLFLGEHGGPCPCFCHLSRPNDCCATCPTTRPAHPKRMASRHETHLHRLAAGVSPRHSLPDLQKDQRFKDRILFRNRNVHVGDTPQDFWRGPDTPGAGRGSLCSPSSYSKTKLAGA